MPEIADGLVEIRGVAREPGYRSKIAVESHAQGVDPVGACVGPRGSRVRMVVSELRGEKIDIIPWNTEPARFVAKALSPARVREVYIDDETREATVVVPDDQLALAIGKEGLNARLAARLTGWKIDIQSDTEFAQAEAEAAYAGDDDGEEFSGRCAAMLSNGKRCPNAALPGSRYCGVPAHQALARRRGCRRRGGGRGGRRPRPVEADAVARRARRGAELGAPRSSRVRRATSRADVEASSERASQDVRGLRPQGAAGRAPALRRRRRTLEQDALSGRGATPAGGWRASSGRGAGGVQPRAAADGAVEPELARHYTDALMADGPNKTESPDPPPRRRAGGRKRRVVIDGGGGARPRRPAGARSQRRAGAAAAAAGRRRRPDRSRSSRASPSRISRRRSASRCPRSSRS